jgi:hypothetical protein
MSQQIPASTPSPVSPAVAAPQAAPLEQGSTAYPQWVASTQGVPSAVTAQAPSQATLPTAPSTNNQSSQFPSTSSPSNPWEAAMGSLERVVSRISPSPSQAAQYPQYQTVQPDTQQLSQSLQAQAWQSQAPTAPLTLSNNGYTTQTSYPTSTAQQPQAPALSEESAAVVNHFGIEAPAVLNQYATTLEDALIQQDQALNNVAARAQAMEVILTDPDHLADYTNRFFTEVYPVDIDTPAVQQESNVYQPQYDQLPAVPASAGAAGRRVDPESQWQGFSQVMNQSPDQAWRYLSQMSPDAIRSKLLFMDAG